MSGRVSPKVCTVSLPLAAILETSDVAVRVELKDGRRFWVSRRWSDFAPGRVELPVWLWRKIRCSATRA